MTETYARALTHPREAVWKRAEIHGFCIELHTGRFVDAVFLTVAAKICRVLLQGWLLWQCSPNPRSAFAFVTEQPGIYRQFHVNLIRNRNRKNI